MSSKNNAFENSQLLLTFNNTNIADIGDSTGLRGSTTAGSLFVSAHSADPGEGGDQTTSELTLGNYGRIGVARSSAGWTVSGNNASNTAQVRIPASGTFSTGGPQDAKFFQVGKLSTGTGGVLYTGHLGEAPFVFVADATSPADELTIKGHNFAVNDEVFVFDAPPQALPGTLTRGLYFVKTVSGDQVTLAATAGGTTIDISTDGGGFIAKVIKRTLGSGDALVFEAGDIDIFED